MPPRNIMIIAVAAMISLSCLVTASRNRIANLFAEGLRVVEHESLIVGDRNRLFDAAMNGMLRSLDPHSAFMSGKAYQEFNEEFQQEFGGVGMYTDIDPDSGRLTVLAPMKDRPAYRGGLRGGDVIVDIDGRSTEGMTRWDAIELLRGRPQTNVSVTFERSETQRTVILTREVIPMASVHGDWINEQGDWEFTVEGQPHLGYIRLSMFANQSAVEFRQMLLGIAPRVAGLIIDLRNNGGGLLPGAVEISDMFLPGKLPIVQIKDRHGRVIQTYESTDDMALPFQIPVVVLINRNSASASEIVAACLQDHLRATVIGEQSYGKGTVQNVIPLERGRSAMKLTVARYARPSNRTIDRDWAKSQGESSWGVLPNPGFEIAQTDSLVFEEYRYRLNKEIRGLNASQGNGANGNVTIVTEPGPDSDTTDNSVDPALPQTPIDYVDVPLQKAIEFLNSITVRTAKKN